MPILKAPHADLRQAYPIHRQIGLILALAVTIAAFTVPLPSDESVVVIDDAQEVIQLQDIDPTLQPPPPPPPPAAALPPPVEVPDDIEVEEDVIQEIELDLDLAVSVPAPPRMPEPPPPPPPAPVDAPPPPPPPPAPEPEFAEPDVFEVAEIQPELIGGLAGLQSRLTYPPLAIRAGVEGQVVVQFVVDERGNVVDPVVLRSPNPILSDAALAAVRESRFVPGQQRGRPVRVRYAVPVTFQLVSE